jgi:hypothetical protein
MRENLEEIGEILIPVFQAFLDSVPSFEGMDNHGVYMWKQNGGPNHGLSIADIKKILHILTGDEG